MQTLAKEDLRCIKKVVLLSPSTGPAMTSDQIYKLVMVSKNRFSTNPDLMLLLKRH